jgi:endonuclease/exonuclease/phosphatase (EEP) superfamily protein YafD
VNNILQRTATEQGPLIIGGDFNTTDQTYSYDLMAAHFHDTFRETGSGLGFTFPADREPIPPLARIDYVFHGGDVLSIASHVWPTSGGSDHRPVWVRLSIKEPKISNGD